MCLDVYLIRLHFIKNSLIIYLPLSQIYRYTSKMWYSLSRENRNLFRVFSELICCVSRSSDACNYLFIPTHKCACNFDDTFSKNETATIMLLEKRSRSLQTASPVIIVIMSRDAITLFTDILLKLQLSGMICFILRWRVVRHYNRNS